MTNHPLHLARAVADRAPIAGLLALAVCGFLACHAAPSPAPRNSEAPVNSAPSTAPPLRTAAASPSPSPAAAPVPIEGRFHLDGLVDAFNLEIGADHVFRYDVNGCDYFAKDDGRWEERDGALVLRPKAGADSFMWPEGASFANKLAELTLRRDARGALVATGAIAGSGPFTQTWAAGAICARCVQGSPVALEPCAASTLSR